MSAFRGVMKLKAAPYALAQLFEDRPFDDLSQISKVDFSASEEKQTIPDLRSPGGGTWATYSRVGDMNLSIELRDFTNENLVLSLWGGTTPLAATAITGEAHVVKAGKFIPAKRIIDLTVPVVLKKGSTAIAPADYIASFGGVTFAKTLTTAGLVDDDDITFDYTPKASVDIEALVNSSPEVSLFGEGVNDFDGKLYTLRVWKAKVGIPANIGFVSETLGTLPMEVAIQKDETIVGVGSSQYFKLERAN